MNRTNAKLIISSALEGYCQDCIGSEEFEEERKTIDKAWSRVSEPRLVEEEEGHLKTILDHLDIDSQLYDTLMKTMRALDIEI